MELLNEAVSQFLNQPSFLEIGPGKGKVFDWAVQSQLLNPAKTVFCEPSVDSAQSLKERYPQSEIFINTFENYLKNSIDLQFELIFAHFSMHWIDSIGLLLQKLYKITHPEGILAVTNTASERSFWGIIDSELRRKFPGCSLFNIDQSRSLTSDDWVDLFHQNGFKTIARWDVFGIATHFHSKESALDDFKKIAGDKYLKLSNDFYQDDIEKWILNRLNDDVKADGRLLVPASAFQLILKPI